ncbi:WD40/YVTN/BNR-like repeat-containing protein, partial [Christiangramia aquimixticola]|uniref:WD40/YVTN/BNR-like repeat-containing protein n=1 Tax=Christiangramia aquimixticola TaxID=1697558 RepID=UPI003AA961B3
NKLMRSMDQGETWTAISNDLTGGGKKGDVPFGTLATISESPYQFGYLYTGSDDGKIYRTKDGGGSWTNIGEKLPQDLWVSRIIASQHAKDRVYLSLNGYRQDDFTPYIYVSENSGESWKSISSNLPLAAVNVIREDPNNENILYLGTDNGLYISLNRGESWDAFSTNFPNVPVHDLRIHKEERDLIVGTHGRSIYIADVAAISEMKKENLKDALSLSTEESIRFSPRWGNSYSKWRDPYQPTIDFTFYSAKAGKVSITIESTSGVVLQKIDMDAEKGFNTGEYDLTITSDAAQNLEKENKDTTSSKADNGLYYIPKGKYKMVLKLNGKTAEEKFEVK